MEKNSYTNWKNLEPVHYKDCNGSLYCLNPNWLYLQEYVTENFINFDKNGNSDIYIVPVKILLLVRQGSIQLFREIQHMFLMLDHILAYQKKYVSDLQNL